MNQNREPATPPNPISDHQAIADVLRGNREMFEVVIRRYNARLYQLGMTYLQSHALAEDAMQNAYINAFLHLGSFQQTASFSTWLTRIMINECLMIIRKRKSLDDHARSDALRANLPTHDWNHGETTMNAKEMKAVLEKAISELPENYRAIYVLREVQQLTTEETAASLDISEASVKVGLHRAREKLKNQLLKCVEGAELFPFHLTYCTPLTHRVMSSILKL